MNTVHVTVSAHPPRVGVASLSLPATTRPTVLAAAGVSLPCTYDIRERGTSRWEMGSGILVTGSPDVLQRVTISDGSSGSAPVDFTNEIDIAMVLNTSSLDAAAGLVAAFASYPKTHAISATLLAASAVSRTVTILVLITTTFAAGSGAAPIFDLGETDTLEKFKADLTTGSAGALLMYFGTLSAGKALLVSGTAATGTGDGAIAVAVFAQPDGT